jgi:general secretion pathway protein K
MSKARCIRIGPPADAGGFVVVAVLWILGALATLAAIYSLYVMDTAKALLLHDESLLGEATVVAALELTAYQITANPQARPGHGAFVFRSGTARVQVEFRSESARVDLNAASKPLLAGLFTVLGARPDRAETYADRILGWRTPPTPGNPDEASGYRTAGLKYGPRLAPFAHIGELSLVLGLPEALVQRALPYLTVYSGQPSISVLDAEPAVLAALPGMSPDRIPLILAEREAAPQNLQNLMLQLGIPQGLAATNASKTSRVKVRITFDNGRRMSAEVVIFLPEGGNEPYQIVSWLNDPDEPLGNEGVTTRLQ